MKSKKLNYIWFAPIITLILLSVLYAIAGIYPFGANSTAFSDGINQYVPMLAEFSRKIKEGGSLFFTWNMGAGTNFWSNLTYYLASPLNLISIFYSSENIYKAFSLITLLSPCLMALTFGIFLKYRYKKNDISVVIFSLLWAFSGFMISNCFFTSWYASIIYFPLVILGLQRLMDGKSAWVYSLFLGLTILSNFYIGWIVCVFCIIYFIYCFIADDDVIYEGVSAPSKNENENNDEASINIFSVFKNSYILSSLFRFAFASLLGGALSAIFTLPTVFTLQNTGKGTISPDLLNPSEIWGILASHIYPMENTFEALVSRDVMFSFAGILSLILCIAYFFAKGISKRGKAGNLFLLIVMWVSVAFHAVYYVWHGFGEPAGIMYRFAFVYTFIIIKIAFEMFAEIEKINITGVAASLVFAGLGIVGLYKNKMTHSLIWSAGTAAKIAVFALLFAVTVLLIKAKPKKRIISVILTVLVAAECLFFNVNHINKSNADTVYTGRTAVEQLLEKSDKERYDTASFTNKPNGFYEMIPYGLLYGYRGLDTYSSMADNNFVLSASNMGAYGNRLNSENGATETTPVFNLLFPTKYVIDGSGRLSENEFRKKLDENDGYTLFENNYTMPFMYAVSGNIGLWRPFSFPVLPDNTNEAFKCLTGIEKNVALYNENKNFSYVNCEHISTVERVENENSTKEHTHNHEHSGEETNNDKFWNYLENKMADFAYRIDDMSEPAYVTYETVAQCDGIMYIFVDTTEFTQMKIEVNGKTTEYYLYGLDENRTFELGEVKKGDAATITIGGKKYADADYVAKESSIAAVGFTVDMDVFREGYEKIDSMSDTQMLEFSDTYVKAKVDNFADSALYIPISYDKGWRITVDGVPTDVYEHESHIMMLSLSKGEHIVEMKYCPQGFTAGAAVSGVSLVILIAWAVISKRRNDKIKAFENAQGNASEE